MALVLQQATSLLWSAFTNADEEETNYAYSPKASQLLGRRKLCSVLGCEQENDLRRVIEEQVEEEFLSCGPYTRCIGRKKICVHKNSKACKLLGYDPSLSKLQDVLGIDDIEEAIEEAQATEPLYFDWF